MVLELEASSAQVQRIVQSKAFRTSEVHRNLLTYLADKSLAGEADSLKEYTVGLDVFAKPASYDPRQESTVRMHVGRLRQKLAEYYRTEGVDDPIIVDLPKGGFKLTFEPRPVAADPEAASDSGTPARRGWPWHEVVLVVALLAAIGAAFYFSLRLRQVESAGSETAAWTPDLRTLWEPLVAPNRPLLIAVSSANPDLATVGTATGLRLGEFFGVRKLNVQVLESDQLGAPEVAMGNVLFLGPPTENRQMQAMSSGRPFVLEKDGIRNVDPQPGEPTLIQDVVPTDPQDTEESYALISRVPGLYGDGEVLYLSGNRVASIAGGVQAFTDPMFARKLVSKMSSANASFPRYFQVVLKVQSMDAMPIDIAYVLHRELPAPARAPESK